MKWKIRNCALDDIRLLQERFGLDLVSAKVLAGRGITDPGAVKFYMENDISFLNNPFMFEDMELFCDRLLQAVEDREKVRVFGDRDVDGITSVSLLVTEFRRLGLDVSYTVPMGDEPYGITRENIDRAVADGVTLAVTVDCGISCYDEIDYANTLGLDFLVTDHHIAGDTLPPACAIIDPKIEGCGYPFAHLAGCGVAAQCIWALRFACTDMYKQPVQLLHAFPGNDTVIIEAARIENLVVTERVWEELVPGVLPQENSRLLRFLCSGLPVLVLDADTELIQMKKAFPKAEIHLTDMRPQFERYLPYIKGKSLFELNSMSRVGLYSQTRSELDTLVGLFCAYVRASHPLLHRDFAALTDLVAIGTISDLMPMEGENRILVRNGLKQLETNTRASLLPFMGLQNLTGHRLSTTDISWQVSPFINAAGRLGRPDIAVNMLLAENESQAYAYARNLVELNKERQKMGEECWERLLPKARENFEKLGSKFVLVEDSRVPRGITGILATRLQKFFKVPALVITRITANTADGRAMGSMRSQAGFNCHDFLSRYADIFEDYGGHACAGGFSLDPRRTEELCSRIFADIDEMDTPEQEEDELVIDAVLPKEAFNQGIMSIIEQLEPYGEQNGPVQFLIEGARIENMSSMLNKSDPSSGHLRLTLQYGSYRWPAVFWGAGKRAGRDFDEGEIADVVFRMGRNYYKNQETIQLTVLDIKRHSSGAGGSFKREFL